MNYRKWLIATLSLILIFAALIVAVNFYVDHHAVRLSLFSGNGEIQRTIYPEGINYQIFKPEVIFRNPDKYDSFLFGSSRTLAVHVDKIPPGRYYNMSYILGSPNQHLAVLKAFLKKGVKIKAVVIGLDELNFSQPATTRERQLIRIMHPDAGGPSRLEIFRMYFFRKPTLRELSLWKDRVILGQAKGSFFLEKIDQIIEKTGKPIFNFTVSKYKPKTYKQKGMDDTFRDIEELIALAHSHHFSITFFINPIYSQQYLNNAEPLFIVKERLAKLTDYYDFSGFNSVTVNPLNYYEEIHYRSRVGDLIAARIFGGGTAKLPDDFGVLVTQKNVDRHLKDQKRELDCYLRNHNMR